MEEEKKDKEKVTDKDDITEEKVTDKDDITEEKVTDKDDITEEKVTHKDEVRETSPVPDKPPVIRLPCCPMPYKTIELEPMSKKTEYVTETSRCQQVVAKLEREMLVAVATEGVNIGKEGPLTLLQIGTCSGAVYIFDVLQNRDLISKGRLRAILESDKIIKGFIALKADTILVRSCIATIEVAITLLDPAKVMNECGQSSAALNFQFAVTLKNVFDTQVAHLVMEEHKGRRLPTGLKVADICLQYAENVEKFYAYDWRTDSKLVWTTTIGNFWALRPLTSEMIEFAAADVMVLIPDIYRLQKEYMEENGIYAQFEARVQEEINLEIDIIVKEGKGKRIARTVEDILYEMDRRYDTRIQLFGVLEEDEMNALALATYEDACAVSSNIQRLKSDHILNELDGLEKELRTGPELWERRSNLFQTLVYYRQIPNPDISAKASVLLKQTLDAVLEHVETKYHVDTTSQMLALCEKYAIQAIDYNAMVSNLFGNVVSTLFWNIVQEEIHEKINFFRLYPMEFALSDDDYKKLEFFRENTSSVPEEVVSLSAALLDTVRAYNVANGNYVDWLKRTHLEEHRGIKY